MLAALRCEQGPRMTAIPLEIRSVRVALGLAWVLLVSGGR